ncbi:MAG: 23S rRNA (pseudouridine(1915)-N(3))-methyltransferase RlmH [Saprospiraceae bacterium]|nr:23S rRNA (pseudouridine(1915)-N(3))-methyltransferase RlmH [Saprospiraceae bacterium]
MKNELWWVGKTKMPEIRALTDLYLKRANHLGSLTINEWQDARSKDPGKAREEIGKKMLEKIRSGDFLILLDEKGKAYSSRQFASFLDRTSMLGKQRAIFVIGGAYGFSDALKSRADHLFALSKMTFPHDLVRIVFLEQYYRALSIQKNLPYHHS